MKWIKRFLLSLLILFALGLIFNKQIIGIILNSSTPEVTKESIAEAKKEKPIIDRSNIDELTPEDIIRHRLSDKKANYIGFVSIPSIGLKQPIINELSNYAISVGAAVYYDNMEMGKDNFVLASHFWYGSETALFSPLYYNVGQGVQGQKVYLTDLEYLYTYETIHYKIVSTSETSYIQQGTTDNLVTLFTCNYNSEDGRVVLQGKLIKKEKLNDVSTKLINEII